MHTRTRTSKHTHLSIFSQQDLEPNVREELMKALKAVQADMNKGKAAHTKMPTFPLEHIARCGSAP